MDSNKGSSIPWIGIAIVLGACILILAYYMLPYNFAHNRRLVATRLRWDIAAWKGDNWSTQALNTILRTNETGSVFLFSTNVLDNSRKYETAIAASHANLREKGIIAGTTNGEVFWIGRNGDVRIIRVR